MSDADIVGEKGFRVLKWWDQSDADIVGVFSRKMATVGRLMQRANSNSEVHAASGGDMKELHGRIAG